MPLKVKSFVRRLKQPLQIFKAASAESRKKGKLLTAPEKAGSVVIESLNTNETSINEESRKDDVVVQVAAIQDAAAVHGASTANAEAEPNGPKDQDSRSHSEVTEERDASRAESDDATSASSSAVDVVDNDKWEQLHSPIITIEAVLFNEDDQTEPLKEMQDDIIETSIQERLNDADLPQTTVPMIDTSPTESTASDLHVELSVLDEQKDKELTRIGVDKPDVSSSVPTVQLDEPKTIDNDQIPLPPIEMISENIGLLKNDPDSIPPDVAINNIEVPHILDPVVDIDPFLVDDPEDTAANVDQEDPVEKTVEFSESPSSTNSGPTPEVNTTPELLANIVPVDVNKEVPPPPETDSDDDKPRSPEVYVPALVMPTMFLPIPNTDPLTTLLIKHVPESHLRPTRDVSGDWQNSDFESLVMTNSWRALARMARDRIVSTNPIEIDLILNLWYLRLSCIARLRLFSQASAECANLFNVLNAIEPVSTRIHVFSRVLPFELDVLRARCIYWAGDSSGYLDAVAALLRRCRNEARNAHDGVDNSMWVERGSRICLILASQFIEMRDYTAATSLLESLMASSTDASASLRSAVARIYLQAGNITQARHHFSLVEESTTVDMSMIYGNAVILASANGEWLKAAENAQKLMEEDGLNLIAINNLAVALLNQGKLKEGISILESALQASPSAVAVAEPFLFNLSTLYELRAGVGVNKKRDLLVEVAKWSGDGLRTTCLKMP